MDRDALLAAAPLLAAALWGGMYVVSKWGFAAVPPLTLVFLRVALGAVILLALVRVTAPERSFTRRDWRGFAGLAGWLAASLSTQFLGTELTNASQGSLLTVLTPVFVLALGVAVLDEALTRRKLAGTGLATVGTLVVLAGRYDLRSVGGDASLGVGLLLFSALCWAGFTVYGKPLIRRYSALEAATWATVLSLPLFALLVPVELATRPGALSGVTVTPAVVAAVVYLGAFSTAGAWYCWYKGMEYADASTVAVFFFAQPVVGTLLGVALLGESVGPGFLVGGVVLAAGVAVVVRSDAGDADGTGEAEGTDAA